MATDLPIRCACGAFRGVATDVSPASGIRVVCYCDHCQAFAHHLGAGETTLDAHGGTDLFQMSPARLRFTQGTAQLSCLRLTPRGPFRWFTSCCSTPVGNTPPTAQLPFVGLVRSCIDLDSEALDRALGPVRVRAMGRYAIGDVAGTAGLHDGFSVSHIARMAWKMLAWRLRGDRRHNPFFDPATGAPVASPVPCYE